MLILRDRHLALREIVSNWSGKEVVNGIVVRNRRLLSKEKLLKVKNMLSEQLVCKLIEEMIVKKLSAIVSQWLQTTQVKVLSGRAVASVSHQIKLEQRLSRSGQQLPLVIYLVTKLKFQKVRILKWWRLKLKEIKRFKEN